MKQKIKNGVVLPAFVSKAQILGHIRLGLEYAILKREKGDDYTAVTIYKENHADWYYYYQLFLVWISEDSVDRDQRFLKLIEKHSHLYQKENYS